MRLINPVAALVDRLRSTYWFLPGVITILAIGLGAVLTEFDRTIATVPPWIGWAYGGGADGARALLSAIAGSTITVVGVTFSVMVVALTVASQHFGPRLLNSFMRDSVSQVVLGTFTGTFAYCLVVLRTVQGDGGDRFAIFVPHVAVTGAVALTLCSVAMLIYYVHHVASSLQVSEITARVAHDFESSIERVYPEDMGDEGDLAAGDVPEPPPSGARVCAAHSGYLQEIDGDRVMSEAREARTTIWLIARPGDFVVEGALVAVAHPRPDDLPALESAIRSAMTFGTDRTSRQDVSFAAQQLIEVALRGLSPGVNEPFTAMTCVDRLGQGLATLAGRKIPGARRLDEDQALRVVARPRRFSDLIVEIFDPIIFHAHQSPQVLARLRDTLDMLAARARRAEDREAIDRMRDLVTAQPHRGMPAHR